MIYFRQVLETNPFLRLHLKVMRILGLAIFDDQPYPLASKVRGYLIMAIWSITNVTQFIDLYATLVVGDLSKMTVNVAMTLLATVSLFQSFRFLYHRSDLMEILCNEMNTSLNIIGNFAGSNAKDRYKITKILTINIRNSNILAKGYWISAFIAGQLMSFYGFWKYLHARGFSAEDRKRVNWLMLKVWYPVDMHEYFIPIYIHQLVISYVGLTLVPLLFTLNTAYMIYAITMLQILKYRCKTITDGIEDIPTMDGRELILHQKFHKHIETQLEIGRFIRNLDLLISPTMFFIFVVLSVLMCFLLFQISTMELSGELMIPVIFMFNMLALLLAFYWLANEIIFHSDDLTNSIYLSKWYMCPKEFKKRMLIFMIGSREPMKLSVLYFTMNLNVFIRILKATFSYYTLLSNMSGHR